MLNLQIKPSFRNEFFKNKCFAKESLGRLLQLLSAQADWVGLRYVSETTHWRGFRNQHPEENTVIFDHGVMVEVLVDGFFSYAGTSDFSKEGIQRAFEKAFLMAKVASRKKIFSFSQAQRPKAVGQYKSPFFRSLDSMTLEELNDILIHACAKLKVSDKIVNAEASAGLVESTICYLTSSGTDIQQEFLMSTSHFQATAQDGNDTQIRSDKGGRGRCYQIGLELFDKDSIFKICDQIGRQAIELLEAPNCPNETMDLILDPDHMLIQIHESIGHPLEMDRILGDERNYAGWSFVKLEDFGKLQYGSPLMNVYFDPVYPGEFASYNFDDCGNKAKKEILIDKGLLVRGLGGLESQARSGLPGVANFRSASWNRAPIDRMANINLNPGSSCLKEMIKNTEKGIFVQSNVSWSIDDYRDKFQFGAEYAKLIENGELTKTVKRPNYRGRTLSFWNSLKAVGNAEEMEIYGSPWCGKGEPSQVIRVGHGSPPCLFEKVEVFGGGK